MSLNYTSSIKLGAKLCLKERGVQPRHACHSFSRLLVLHLSYALSHSSSLSLNSILVGALAGPHGQTQARPGRHGNRAPSPRPFSVFCPSTLDFGVCRKRPGKTRPPWIPSTKLGVHRPAGLSGRFPLLQPPKSGQMRKTAAALSLKKLLDLSD